MKNFRVQLCFALVLSGVSLVVPAAAFAQDVPPPVAPAPAPTPAPPATPAAPATLAPSAAPAPYAAPGPYAAPAPYAPVPVADMGAPGVNEHDGFYLRLALGGGYTSMSASYQGSDGTISGGAMALGVAIGGAVSRNLIIYGEFSLSTIGSPEMESGGESTTRDDLDVSVAGFGPGMAYYVEPLNLYFSGTLLFERLSMKYDDDSDSEANSDMGVGGTLAVGKEWWVSDNWGLGLAGQVHMGSVKDGDTRWTVTSFAIVGSATFN